MGQETVTGSHAFFSVEIFHGHVCVVILYFVVAGKHKADEIRISRNKRIRRIALLVTSNRKHGLEGHS